MSLDKGSYLENVKRSGKGHIFWQNRDPWALIYRKLSIENRRQSAFFAVSEYLYFEILTLINIATK